MKIMSLVLAMVSVGASTAQAVSTSGNAKIKVQTQISATASRDLDFGTVTQGDGAAAVLATDAQNSAAFDVSGEPNKSYSISLPSSIIMKNGAGGTPDTEIQVSSFSSDKASNVGSIDGTGSDSFQVGASRAAIRTTQASGNYSGSFTIDLVYQ